MELIRELGEVVDLLIRSGPISDSNSHEAEVVKPAKQADHAGDIIRIDLAPCKSLMHDGHIWSGLFELDASKFISKRRPDGIQVCLEVRLGTRTSVLDQTDNRLFLSFRPIIFALDVGTHGRQNHGSEGAEKKNKYNDANEQRNYNRELSAQGRLTMVAAECHFRRAVCKKIAKAWLSLFLHQLCCGSGTCVQIGISDCDTSSVVRFKDQSKRPTRFCAQLGSYVLQPRDWSALFPPMPTRKATGVLAFLVRPAHFFQCDCMAVDGHDGFFAQRPPKTDKGYGSPIHGGGGAPVRQGDGEGRKISC